MQFGEGIPTCFLMKENTDKQVKSKTTGPSFTEVFLHDWNLERRSEGNTDLAVTGHSEAEINRGWFVIK